MEIILNPVYEVFIEDDHKRISLIVFETTFITPCNLQINQLMKLFVIFTTID